MGTAIDTFFYFLAFFALVGSASVVFLGLPLPGTLRMASRAFLGYTAPVVMGSIPALFRRICTVLYGTSRSSASSEMVYPSIFILDYRRKNIFEKVVFTT